MERHHRSPPGLVERTEFQCIDQLMRAWKGTEELLLQNRAHGEVNVAVGPYGMLELKTTIYGPSTGQDTKEDYC